MKCVNEDNIYQSLESVEEKVFLMQHQFEKREKPDPIVLRVVQTGLPSEKHRETHKETKNDLMKRNRNKTGTKDQRKEGTRTKEQTLWRGQRGLWLNVAHISRTVFSCSSLDFFSSISQSVCCPSSTSRRRAMSSTS